MNALRRTLVRVGAMAHKEALHIQRDPLTLYLALVLPMIMLVLFGYGVSFDLDHYPLAIDDRDHTPESRALIDDLTAAGELHLLGAADADDAAQLFAAGAAEGILTIPAGYAATLARGETATVGLLLDAADAQTTQAVLARTEAMAQVATAKITAARMPGLSGSLPLSARLSTRYNPAGRSALFLVPGLTAYVLALVAVLLTSLSVAREWERGSMEQLFSTPVGRFEILAGKVLPYLAIGVVQVMMVLTAGAWVFDVPARGDLSALALASVLFLVGMLGQGLLISVVTRNQMVATQAATMSSMLPTMLLSGFLFPIANMPTLLQWVSALVPSRYYIRVLRGVLLKGNGFAELWPDLLALTAFAALMFIASTARFPRRLA
jgi:ABC-2 type transport system permease protein